MQKKGLDALSCEKTFVVHVVEGIPEGLICMIPLCCVVSWEGKQDDCILVSLETYSLLLESVQTKNS